MKNQELTPPQDVSWLMLLSVATVVVGSAYLLSYNVLYTEGEVIQRLFTFLVFVTAGSVLIGFYRRKIAVWCVTLLGGSLLLWQTYQARKCIVIHEDIVAIVQFAVGIKKENDHYPTNLEGYVFKNEWVKSHVYGFGTNEADGFRITYFMNDPGITYWYSAKTGFGYYPD